MDYHDRKTAKVNITRELVRRGWKVYGYKADESDSMTDYYSPANWEGVADKDGAVICVDVGDYTVKECSGGRTRHRSVPAETCQRCNGTGKEPNGWTYTEAKANPREFNRQRCAKRGGGMNLMAEVVSPAHFIDYGAERCAECSGMGHKFKMETYTEPWPTFQANPKRRLWHVERNGEILASGVGLSGCVFGEPDEVRANITRLVDKMESVAFGKAPSKPTKKETPAANGDASFTRTGAWTWLSFAGKPAQEIIDALKTDGWRWSKKRCAWYSLDGKEPPASIMCSVAAS